MLTNFANYGPFAEFARTGKYTLNVSDITIDTWQSYYDGILNIFKDGIETDEVQKTFIVIDFGIATCELAMVDLFFNIIMWYLIIRTGNKIEPKHLFFSDAITGKSIKKYIDDFFIKVNRKTMSNIEMNVIISDMLHNFAAIDQFSMYFANTINLEDNIDLMRRSKEFYDIIHVDLSGVPIEDVKSVGMDITNKAIDIMKNSKSLLGYDHCLADSWRAQEGINPRQYKEFSINIGSKPNGQGGVYPSIINKSFITGGVNDPLSMLIDSSTGRTAQLLSKVNVGDSGAFARILGLNNTDTYIHKDREYDCHSPNYEVVTIRDKKFLEMYNDRYYRLHPMGEEFLLNSETDHHLIGKTIYVRSPMTCLSNAKGHGICYKCYGDLAYINHDINIGKMAAEILTSQLTQRLLSAKHLLETIIKKMKWVNEFWNFFDVDCNIIQLSQDINSLKGYTMIIDPESIYLENEDDYKKSDYDDDSYEESENYNEYITRFIIKSPTDFVIETPDGNYITIRSEDYDKLYITNDLNEVIRDSKKAYPLDGKICIPMIYLVDIQIFLIIIQNNELSRAMERIMDIINKNSITKSMDRHQLLQAFVEAIIDGNLTASAVHCEVILSNQLRDFDDILELPDWSIKDAPYQILTLNQALTNHPSVVISLMYQRLSKTLYNPLTFRKNKPSFLDLFFMDRPQEYLYNTDNIIPAKEDEDAASKIINPFIHINENEEE